MSANNILLLLLCSCTACNSKWRIPLTESRAYRPYCACLSTIIILIEKVLGEKDLNPIVFSFFAFF